MRPIRRIVHTELTWIQQSYGFFAIFKALCVEHVNAQLSLLSLPLLVSLKIV